MPWKQAISLITVAATVTVLHCFFSIFFFPSFFIRFERFLRDAKQIDIITEVGPLLDLLIIYTSTYFLHFRFFFLSTFFFVVFLLICLSLLIFLCYMACCWLFSHKFYHFLRFSVTTRVFVSCSCSKIGFMLFLLLSFFCSFVIFVIVS